MRIGGWASLKMALLSLALVACGSSSAPADGGGAADGGARDAGPPIDAGPCLTGDAGCTSTSCPNVAGSYQLCVNCPSFGTVGPMRTEVIQVCGCQYNGCVFQDTTNPPNCAVSCVDAQGGATLSLVYLGTAVACTGSFTGAGVDGGVAGVPSFFCPAGGLNCTALMRPAGTTSCQ